MHSSNWIISPGFRVTSYQEDSPNLHLLGRFARKKGQIQVPIPSMRRAVYLPTWMVDFYGFHVGKYTIHGCYGVWKFTNYLDQNHLLSNICTVSLTYFQDFHTKSSFQVQESRICELCTLHKIHISHRKGSSETHRLKTALERDMLVPRRVYTSYGSMGREHPKPYNRGIWVRSS